MDIPNSDIVIPVAIIAVCFLIVVVTFRLTRRRGKGWELDDLDQANGVDDTLIDIDALDAWNRDYGSVVTGWINSHEESLDTLSKSGLQLDLTSKPPAVNDTISSQMRNAITAHPTPAMRAQLSAMTVAAEATVVAVRRSDYTTAERQHLTYVEYRDQWLHRLRQFSPDDRHLGTVAAEADRHGADWTLRPVPDLGTGPEETESASDPSGDEGALVTQLDVDANSEVADPWQITRPRKSKRRRRRAG